MGAGIGLSESTLQVLNKIGCYQAVQANGKFVKQAILAKKDFSIIRRIPTESDGMCIDRTVLIDILSKGLRNEKYTLSKTLRSIENSDSGVTLKFATGEEAQLKLLIACDGINSKVREEVYPTIKKRYSGQTIWRGIADISLPEKFSNTYFELWGDNLRFGLSPMTNRRFYWYAAKMAPAGEREQADESKNALLHLFKNYSPIVKDVIENSPKIVRDDMWDLRPHSNAWHKEAVLFLGDSIHATTPNLAQGGCQAIEDAYTLAKCFSEYGVNQESFKIYEKLRRPKTTYIVKKSWQFGRSAHSKIPFLVDLNKLTLRYVLPDSFFTNQYRVLTDLEYLQQIAKDRI